MRLSDLLDDVYLLKFLAVFPGGLIGSLMIAWLFSDMTMFLLFWVWVMVYWSLVAITVYFAK